jgi:hypothetical protein
VRSRESLLKALLKLRVSRRDYVALLQQNLDEEKACVGVCWVTSRTRARCDPIRQSLDKPKGPACVRVLFPAATLFAHLANVAPNRIQSGRLIRSGRPSMATPSITSLSPHPMRNQLLHRTRTLWEQRGSREASNLKSATCTDVFYANIRVHVSPGTYGITRWRRRRRRRDPSVMDSCLGARGKREASDGNKP